ncbi:MAG TPA: permease prefix domain 1-containing protein [Verrucomicrobiae bacterium]|nr:permease prefix domain 1-containing protein [Verrucomicrobiae bacterium]
MANQTRFDLNAAIENWRNELAAQPNLTADDRRELETHLRDAIAGFRQRGLNDEESFWLARRRVGQPQQLGEEFVKADPAKIWRERILWIAIGFLAVEFWTSFANVLRGMFPYNFSRDDLNSTIFYETVLYGPIIWIVISLVLGRMDKIRVWGGFIFRSRLLFVVIAVGIVALFLVFNCFQIYQNMMSMRFPELQRQFIQRQLEWALSSKIGPCLSIALVAWLMPTENRKTRKLA